ncbi:tape measure protein [Devosia sp. WQ 349]|uniref:tape measure protein n=1 Tax=Devosia sp. WQ 349K1 TaxID=2800329 RepID=UPI001908055E|nr:tape measure protein [Devosia sp. WQ 349K1]MBK1793357.1 tape measure protein [Devosia sp. WQ 349K1]
MATDIERLIVSLEASTNKYERALAKANSETDKRVGSMQRQFDGLSRSAQGMQGRMVGAFGSVGRAFGVLGIALTTTSIISMTSAWTDLNSRVNNAAGGIERGAAVMGRLSEMARRTYSSLEQTSEGYLQNQQALSALGYSTEQQLDLVETLNNALVVGAVRGQRAQSVMDAWSKAMASGSLRGENLNIVIQSGGRLSKALADSMGVSVNELRKLGEEGKITTDKMYGVTSQMEALRVEAGNMPATVADGFILLKDAVMIFVGEADKAVGSSAALAEGIIAISDAISNAPDQPLFDKVFNGLGNELAQFLSEGAREIAYIAQILVALSKLGKSPADGVVALNEALGGNVRTAEEYELALTDAEQAIVNLAVNTKGRFGEVDAAVQDLFNQILKGRGSVEKAHQAVEALASVNPDFAALKTGVLGVIDTFFAMRDAANAARAAAASTTNDLGDMPSWRQFGKQFAPDLSNEGKPGGPSIPSSLGSKGGGKSAGDKYGDSIEQFQRKIDMLKQETALTAALNPLLNDYGYAKERLKAVQELENAAIRAGLDLGPDQRAQIEALATGYATATAEAARLAEAQNKARQTADELAQAGRNALDSIIDGFLEGKDAGELLNSVMQDLLKNLIKMGINAIGGGLFGGGGGGIFGAIGSMFGFAKGTANTGGRRGEARGVVHGQEAVIPLPAGGKVPVIVQSPQHSPQAAQPQALTVHVETNDEKMSAYVTDHAGRVVGGAAPALIRTSVNASPAATAEKQLRYGMG